MEEIKAELAALVGKTKAARLVSECVTAPDTMAANDLAHTLAQIGQEFANLAVKLKQAGRRAADEAAAARPQWKQQRNAARAARELERKGAIRL